MTPGQKRLRKWTLGITAAFAVYLAVGFLLVPYVAKRQLVAYVEQDLGHRITIGDVRFNPLKLTAELRDVDVRTPGGEALLSFSRLFADLAARGMFDLTWTLDEVTLERPFVTAVIGPGGDANFGPLLEALGRGDPGAAPPDQDGGIPAVLIRRVSLVDGQLAFADLTQGPDAKVTLLPLEVTFTDLATAPDARSPYAISASTAAGETVRWRGYVSLNPIASSGRIAFENWKLDTLARFVESGRPLSATGRLDITGNYRLAYRDGALSAAGDEVEVRFSDPALAPGTGADPLLAFDAIVLSNGRFDLQPRTAGFARVVATRPRVALAYAPDGTANWQSVAPGARAGPAGARSTGAGSGPGQPGPGTVAGDSESGRTAPADRPSAPLPGSPDPAPTGGSPGADPSPAAGAGAGSKSRPPGASASGGKNALLDPAATSPPASPPASPPVAGSAGTALAEDRRSEPATPPGAVGSQAVAASASLAERKGAAPVDRPAPPAGAGEAPASRPAHEPGAPGRAAPAAPEAAANPGQEAAIGTPAVVGTPTSAPTPSGPGAGATASDAPSAATPADGSVGPQGPWRIRIGQVEVADGSFTLADARNGESTRLELQGIGLRLGVELSLGASLASRLSGVELTLGSGLMRQGESVSRLEASTLAIERLAADTASPAGAEGGAAPVASASGLALELGAADIQQAGTTLKLAPSRVRLGPIEARTVESGTASEAVEARLEGIEVALGAGEVRRESVAARFEPASLAVGDTRATLPVTSADAREATASAGAVAVKLGRIEVTAGAERLSVAGVRLDAGSLGTGGADASRTAKRPTLGRHVAFGKLEIALGGVSLAPASGKQPVAQVDSTRASAGAVRIGLDGGIETDALSVGLDGLDVRHPADRARLAFAQRARVEGVEVDTAARRVDIARVRLEKAGGTVAFNAQGALNWEAVLALREKAAAKTGTPGAKAPPGPATSRRAGPEGHDADPAWRVAVKQADYREVSASYRDMRAEPPLEVDVVGITGRVSDIGTDARTTSRIEAQGRLRDGGDLAVNGRVNRHTGALDLAVRVGGIPLAKAQPWVSRATFLQIRSGTASAEGRLRRTLAKGDPGLRYEGSARIQDLRLDEPSDADPFFVLADATTSDLSLSLDPGRLEIGQLALRGMAGKLLIDEQQQVNLRGILKQPDLPRDGSEPDRGRAAGSAKASSPSDATPEPPAFPVSVSRIRVDDSRLQFADLSLTPQFATRIHELAGVISGVSSAPDARTAIELQGRVNEYGSATIKGALDVFDPKRFTDVTMSFRNLEMKSITPYSAKFAGYRIASGTLSADLTYRIEQRKLVGQNKLVIDKLQLGEKVDSPSALDLPLELGIALLKDSRGVIDIGLPVRGDLANPEFDFGELIGKAIGNLIVGIVTAPFRFLGSLFGGKDGGNLDAIAFEPGKARLQPPERQKLDTVAEALAKRPQLALTVKPRFDPARDLAALKSEQARREVLVRAGVKLGADEDPGPLDLANPRQRAAAEEIFVERFDYPALRDLREALAKQAGGQPAPAALAEAMVQRLTESIAIGEARVADLGRARGEAIERGLVAAKGGIDAARIRVRPAVPAETAGGNDVVAELEIGAR